MEQLRVYIDAMDPTRARLLLHRAEKHLRRDGFRSIGSTEEEELYARICCGLQRDKPGDILYDLGIFDRPLEVFEEYDDGTDPGVVAAELLAAAQACEAESFGRAERLVDYFSTYREWGVGTYFWDHQHCYGLIETTEERYYESHRSEAYALARAICIHSMTDAQIDELYAMCMLP